ncbi:MAG TPA: NUDIX domain-containing protein [Candidatus Saccharibacteria bacterium]|nr:NUDIX domain-containing protein [Candidatus Saccharibacteria bacterium]
MINSDEEFSIVVDKNDRILRYTKRGDLLPTDRIRVTTVWIEDKTGRILIAQRSPSKRLHPGLWGPAAAGGVAKGETYEQNAYKELEEEIGVTNVKLRLHDKTPVDYFDGTRRFAYSFIGILDEVPEQFTLEDAVEQVKWVDKGWLKNDLRLHPEQYVPSAVQHWHDLFLR